MSALHDAMKKAVKPEKKSRSFVAEKIATYKSKKRRPVLARSRKGGPTEARGYISNVIKKAASIAELLTRDDQEENLRVIREAKNATHHIFNVGTKTLDEVPDHKTRLAAVVIDLGYSEGKPVDRQLSLNVKYDELSEDMELLKNSPAGKRFLAAIGMVQKSGGEKLIENAREIPNQNEVHESNDS